ncbi:hypothetical protein MMPV_004579 [Pyropia vietnamensis]
MAVITVSSPDGEFTTLNVPLGTTNLAALGSLAAAELGLRPPLSFQLNGSPLAADAPSLESAGVADGDLLLAMPGLTGDGSSGGGGGGGGHAVTSTATAGPAGLSSSAPSGLAQMMGSRGPSSIMSAQQLIEQATAQPRLLAALEAMSPPAAAAVRRRDVAAVQGFLDILGQAMGWQGIGVGGGSAVARGGGGIDAAASAAMSGVDLQEVARLADVTANFEAAFEHVPESFTPVVMLYVRAAVAGVPVTAFVDSGAQATILSRSTAKRCGVERLLDTRFAGVARGVGTAKILGKVHLALLTLGGDGAASLGADAGAGSSSGDGAAAPTPASPSNDPTAEPLPSAVLDASFTVMEDSSFDMLLGLDMLKKHRMVIDLDRNALVVHGIAVPFLPERDIPKNLLGSEGAPAPPGEAAAGASSGGALLSSPSSVSALRGLSAAAAAGAAAEARMTGGAPALAAPNRAGLASPAGIASSGTSVARRAAAAATTPATAGSSGGGSGTRPAAVPEASVTTLMGLGFSRAEAIQALAACGGNAELAANMLSQAKYGF